MLLISICLVSFDVYYYVWALKAQHEVPPEIRDTLMQQLKGVAVKVNTQRLALQSKFKEQAQKVKSKVRKP